jgi:hypothetical protein
MSCSHPLFGAWDIFEARDAQGVVFESVERRPCVHCNFFEERNHRGERIVYDSPSGVPAP